MAGTSPPTLVFHLALLFMATLAWLGATAGVILEVYHLWHLFNQ